MNPDNDKKYMRVNKLVLAAIVVILLAFFIGLKLGNDDPKPAESQTTSTPQPTQSTEQSSSSEVKSLVSYVIPDGWKEASCSSNSGSVFISDSGNVDCNATPPTPVALAVDPANTKDCNQLQNAQAVKKHTCISLYINGKKSLKASTEYLESSSYKKATTVNAYYIDTGKGVVKASYTFNSDNPLQAGFDQFANSINSKN